MDTGEGGRGKEDGRERGRDDTIYLEIFKERISPNL